jgi:hypothetical protein
MPIKRRTRTKVGTAITQPNLMKVEPRVVTGKAVEEGCVLKQK